MGQEQRAPASVLVVDDNAESARALQTVLDLAGHRALIAHDGASALRQLSAQSCQLVLCSVSLADMDGLDVCRAIKAAPATRQIPVIMVGADGDEVQRQRAMDAGADDYAVKPIERTMVLGLVRAQLRISELNGRLHELEAVIVSLARAVDDRDPGAGGKSERVAHWSMRLGTVLGLPEEELTLLYKAALLHDVGSVAVPAAILAKPGRLDADEFRQVKRHPIVSEQLLGALPHAERILPGIRHHHERIDGGGYPDGLRGTQIPLFARIIAIADAFTALTNDRPYRRRMSKAEATRTLEAGAGAQWDADLLKRFLRLLDDGATQPRPSSRQVEAG